MPFYIIVLMMGGFLIVTCMSQDTYEVVGIVVGGGFMGGTLGMSTPLGSVSVRLTVSRKSSTGVPI